MGWCPAERDKYVSVLAIFSPRGATVSRAVRKAGGEELQPTHSTVQPTNHPTIQPSNPPTLQPSNPPIGLCDGGGHDER
ncbi:MAG: hypothetical protein ACPGWR_22790 [Ardenticatenaceae bacterium]